MPDAIRDLLDDPQPALLPLTQEEMRAAGQNLAALITRRDLTRAEHKEVRTEQKAELERLDNQIAALAGMIRTQGR